MLEVGAVFSVYIYIYIYIYIQIYMYIIYTCVYIYSETPLIAWNFKEPENKFELSGVYIIRVLIN